MIQEAKGWRQLELHKHTWKCHWFYVIFNVSHLKAKLFIRNGKICS